MTYKVLVTGGAGFIGSHVIEKFSKRKYQVTIVDDLSTGKKENVNTHRVHEVIVANIVNMEHMHQIFERIQPDIVLHLAAQPSLLKSIQSPFTDLTTNGIGTMIIAKLCKEYNVSKLVYASTSAVIDSTYQEPTTPPLWEYTPTSPYGLSKLVGEMYVKHFMTDAIILRLGNVYGPKQIPLGENQLVPRAIRYALGLDDFEVYGSGNQTRDYVYAGDVADAFLAATKAKRGGTYYVGTGESVSVWDVLDEIEKHLKVKDWPIGKERDARESIQLDVSATAIASALGWQAKTPLSKGIAKTVKWWRNEYEKSN